VSRAAFDPRNHLGPAEVDGAPAAQRRGVLDEYDLFIVAEPLHDLLGLNQPTRDLLPAGGLVGRTGTVLPARRRPGAFGHRITKRGKFAAGAGEEVGRLVVLNMGEEAEVGRVKPGLPALMAPALGELAERLVKQAEIDTVLAAGVARGLENAHVAEPGDLIEQKQYPARAAAAGLVDGIEQCAEDDARGLRARLEDLERQVDEDVELAGKQVARPEALTAGQTVALPASP
jgi:hypothetical protein